MEAADSRIKTATFWMLLLALGAVSGLYGAEFVFRNGVAVRSVPQTDREFRELVAAEWPRPVPAAKHPGTIRILGLADSFGLASGENNYHYRLERLLRERGHDVEVVNLSVAAYSLEQELRLLRRFGPRFEPDIVLHGFFVGNDFHAGGGESMRFRGIHVDVEPGLRSWYPQNLLLPRWYRHWRTAVGERRHSEVDTAGGAGAGSFSEASFLRIERIRLSTCRRPKREGPAWPGVVRLLDAIGAETERMGAVRMMVVHPDQFQVEPALADRVIREYDLAAEDYDLDLPQKFLRAYAESRRVSLVDLTPAFRRSGAEGGLYRLRDTHYNDAGNLLAAEVVADRLEPLLQAVEPVAKPPADAVNAGRREGSARRPA